MNKLYKKYLQDLKDNKEKNKNNLYYNHVIKHIIFLNKILKHKKIYIIQYNQLENYNCFDIRLKEKNKIISLRCGKIKMLNEFLYGFSFGIITFLEK